MSAPKAIKMTGQQRLDVKNHIISSLESGPHSARQLESGVSGISTCQFSSLMQELSSQGLIKCNGHRGKKARWHLSREPKETDEAEPARRSSEAHERLVYMMTKAIEPEPPEELVQGFVNLVVASRSIKSSEAAFAVAIGRLKALVK